MMSLGLFRLKLSIFLMTWIGKKKVHLGLQLKLPLITLSGGLSELYPTYGVGVNLGVFQIQYTHYLEELASLVGINPEMVPSNAQELKLYFENISPELYASDDAKRVALFLTFPPMPTAIRFATPAAPAWASLSALATAALPQWARKLYAIPSLPGQDVLTNAALVATRSTLKILPENIFQPPLLKEALIRWGIAS
jgi:hypothetical protein